MTTRTGRNGTSRGRSHARRLRVLQVGAALLALGFGGRLFQLQLLEDGEWRAAAREQQAIRVEIPARRGGFYDRHDRPLALDAREYTAFLAPAEIRDPERAFETAGRILGLTARELRRMKASSADWVPVPRRLAAAERDRLMGAVRRGLYFEDVTTRRYPDGGLGRSLLGAVDGEGKGASGLELTLDSLLRGRPGTALARADALGDRYWLPDAQVDPARPGHDVVLTIDAELQAIAENALERALAESGASGGDIVLMDPRTGELLGVASRREGYRRVPAFTDPYEPGSTMKPFLLAALLSEGRARLTDSVYAEDGAWRDGRRWIRDVHPYDTLSVAEVIQYSSNIGAVKLAKRLPPALHYRYLRDFGFGIPVGIEYPAEAGGTLRRPDEWSSLSQASLAMGYEVSVTTLQLAAAYGALANGGVLMRPYLVREIRDGEGRPVLRRRPEPLRRVVDARVARAVTGVLTRVVKEGTATRAALTAMAVAGKTGTARLTAAGRYERGRYASSFVGYTPAEDPRLVVVTKLEDPQGAYYGGTVAAPVSQAALQAALASRGGIVEKPVAPRSPARHRWGGGDPEPDRGRFIFAVGASPTPWPEGSADADDGEGTVLPDLRGLPVRAAAARLHALGLRVALRAAGRVEGQDPPPGRRAAPGSIILLR